MTKTNPKTMDKIHVVVDSDTRQLFDEATTQWGPFVPTTQAIEECGEFIQAAAKLLNDKPRDPDNFIEEAADAIICITHAIHQEHSIQELNEWIDRKMLKFEGKVTRR